MSSGRKTFNVQTAHDLFESIMKCSPISAIEELIWNALDADAQKIDVKFQYNGMGGLKRIIVCDDGFGIKKSEYKLAFGSLGGSLKKNLKLTQNGRVIHGKEGKGRICAFRLGGKVTWRIRSTENGVLSGYDLVSFANSLNTVIVENEKTLEHGLVGTEVIIDNIEDNHPSLMSDLAIKVLCRHLSVYLLKYQSPSIILTYDGTRIDPLAEIQRTKKFLLKVPYNNEIHNSELEVLEWKEKVDRKIHLCDESGFTIEEIQPGVNSSGISFTAHLKSAAIPLMLKDNVLLNELDPSCNKILKITKDKLRVYFKKRKEEKNHEIIEGWKRDKIYPYESKPTDPVIRVRKNVFDICALTIHKRLPSFKKLLVQDKQFQFQLLKLAIEDNPTSLGAIMKNIFNLKQEEQDGFASLLERTKLSSVIKTTSLVIDRINFIESLNVLLFTDYKKQLLETKQLHKMLLDNLWIFGEQYQISNSDQRLTTLLKDHIKILERDCLVPDTPNDISQISDEELKKLRIDLMLYTRIPSANTVEHFIIELKRPSVTIKEQELTQITRYANAIIDDARFDKNKVRWTFLLLGNELDSLAKRQSNQPGRGQNILAVYENATIYVKTWAEIIEEAKWRYDIYYKDLVSETTKESTISFLEEKYGYLLPQLRKTQKNKTAQKASVTSKSKKSSKTA